MSTPHVTAEDKLQPQEHFEVFALTLLLCTPSELNQAFTAPDATPQTIDAAIDSLNFSQHFKILAKKEVALLFRERFFFKGVADTFLNVVDSGFYAGSPPHPSPADTVAIIQAMQKLGKP